MAEIIFGEIFGDPKVVTDAAHRAIAELAADVTECGDGLPGSWQVNAPLAVEDLDVLISTLRDVADIATQMKLQLMRRLENKALLRAEFLYLMTQLVPFAPDYESYGLGGVQLYFDELPDEARAAQRSEVAAQLGKDAFSPEVESILPNLLMSQMFETVSDIEDDEIRAATAKSLLMLTMTRLGPLTREPEKRQSSIIIPGEFKR
jgi:hypothetical protein